MNKKLLALTVALLTVVMLATPTVSACRPRRKCVAQDFTATVRMADPTTNPPGEYVPGTTEFVGPKDSDVPSNPNNPENRKYQINKGGMFFGVIESDQLGNGTMTSTPIIGIMDLENGVGFGVFKWKWEFDNPTCKGAIEGIYTGKQTVDFPLMYIEGKAFLRKGTGDLKNSKILVSSYEATLDMPTFTTLGFSGTIEGKMWSWTTP